MHADLTVFIPSSSNLTFFLKDGLFYNSQCLKCRWFSFYNFAVQQVVEPELNREVKAFSQKAGDLMGFSIYFTAGRVSFR